jgi:hypothetical protein
MLRAFHTAVLFHDGTAEPVLLVVDPATGRPVVPISPRVFDADEHVLHLPEEGESALQLLVIPEEIDPGADPGADRWRIYHGQPQGTRWSRFAIDCARLGRAVLDGAELMHPNYLAPHEPGLLRRAGADPSRLVAAVRARRGLDVEHPVAVGIDPLGLDIRARFGIVRLEFDDPIPEGSEAGAAAARTLDQLLNGDGRGA